MNGLVQRPYAALRCIPRHCDVLPSTPHSSGFARLAYDLCTKPLDTIHVAGKTDQGFTFIELVVVIVIMSVLISVGSPYLSNFYKGIKIESSARQLRIFLNNAREVALSEKKICRVKIGPEWRKFMLYVQKDPVEKPEEYERVEGSVSSYDMLADIEIESIEKDKEGMSRGSEVSVDVYPLFAAQEITFTLKDSAGNKNKVKIEAGSGRVAIE